MITSPTEAQRDPVERASSIRLASSSRPALAAALAATVIAASGCTQDPVEVSLRSLERSGAVAFVCLGSPGSGSVPRPVAACTPEEADGPDDFVQGEDGGELPHLYAFVTQTTRGEVAVVDLSSADGNVLDQDSATSPRVVWVTNA